jgi:FtsH-binding integral membrane protein
MWHILGSIVEMFVYASVYMIIVIVGVKVVGSSLSAEFEKRLSQSEIGPSLICASLFIGIALLVVAVIRG